MRTTRQAIGGDRYQFDFDACHYKKGWAQIDTAQDASYFGTWVNPHTLTIVQFCEGDLTVRQADTRDEFAAELEAINAWNIAQGMDPIRIDGMCTPALIEELTAVGMAHLLH